MKYCSNCGTQLPDEAQFCRNCGMSQQPAASQPAAPEKKSLGQKMMDNFHTNMELQKQRRSKFKWWYWVIIAMLVAYALNM